MQYLKRLFRIALVLIPFFSADLWLFLSEDTGSCEIMTQGFVCCSIFCNPEINFI